MPTDGECLAPREPERSILRVCRSYTRCFASIVRMLPRRSDMRIAHLFRQSLILTFVAAHRAGNCSVAEPSSG